MLAESAFGLNSTKLTFIQSLYTDVVNLTNTLTTHTLQTDLLFESGVGSIVEMEVDCLDFQRIWRAKKVFSLSMTFFFDIIPGSAYNWTVVSSSRGSNPLLRIHTYSDYTLPMTPIPLMQAAATLPDYDTFVLTVGNEPMTERSTKTIQFKWAQERRIEEYIIRDLTLDRNISHVIESSGWILDDYTELTPGMKYTYEVTTLSHGLESSEKWTIEDSTYPLPPRENSSLREVDDREVNLTVEYFGFVQHLRVVLNPSEGLCTIGCSFDPIPNKLIGLTDLTPGQNYTVTLSTESYGKYSEVISFTEEMEPGHILLFLPIVSSDKITIELEIEAGVGTEITVDYVGKYTGHSNTISFPYELISRLVLENMRPSESYNITVTIKGRGVNFKSRQRSFEAHLYPSDVTINDTDANAHDFQITYSTHGEFSYIEIVVSPGSVCPCEILDEQNSGQTVNLVPPGSGCPCKIFNKAGSGLIIIGDENLHPLTAGEEYFVYIRTFSFYGLESTPIFMPLSLPVDQVSGTNNRVEGGTAKFEVDFESGIGSYIHVMTRSLGVSMATQNEDVQFSLHFEKDVPIETGQCIKMTLFIYSKGSNPERTIINYDLALAPKTPSLSSGIKVTLTYYDPTKQCLQMNSRAEESAQIPHAKMQEMSGIS